MEHILSTRTATALGRIAAVALFLLSSAAHAGDRRLSYDPVQMILPPSAQFQSAARIGDVTLAVWGSTRLRADSSVATVMYWQLVRGNVPVGQAALLTDDRSVPDSSVEIAVLRDRFVVLWNDARTDGGVRAVVIDTGGTRRSEQSLTSGMRIARGSVVVLAWARDYRIVWSDAARPDDQYEFLLDSLGNARALARRSGTGVATGLVRLADSAKMTLLMTAGGPPRLFDVDGSEVRIADSAVAKFRSVYQVAPDGAVVTADGKDFAVFASVLDSVPIRRVAIPQRFAFSFNNVKAFGRLDSSGRIECWVFVANATGSLGYVWVEALVYRSLESAAGAFDTSKILKQEYVAWLPASRGGYTWLESSGLKVSHTCGLGARAEYNLRYATTGGRGEWWYTVVVPGDSTIAGACSRQTIVNVARRPTRDSSSVVVTLATPVILSAPAAHAPVNVVDEFPCLAVHGDTVLMGSISNGVDTNAVISWWEPGIGVSARVLHTLGIDHEYDRPPVCNSYRSNDLIVDAQGECYLVSSVDWRVLDTARVIDSQLVRLSLLTSDGWRPALTRIDGESGSTLRVLRALDDPVGQQTFVLLASIAASGARSRPSVAAIDRTGRTVWEFVDVLPGTLPDAPGLIATGTSEFLLQGNAGTTRFAGGAPVRTMAPALPPVPSLFAMGGQGTYVRAFGYAEIMVQVVDTLGGLLHESPTLVLPAGHHLRSIARDSRSGRLALVSSGSAGVGLALLDSTARVLRSFSIVSDWRGETSTPSVVFSGDSLFIAWVDARRGVADVWSTVIAVSDFVLDIDLDRPAGWQLIVSPNPARDGFTVRLAGARCSRLRLADALGRLVFEQTTERTGVVRVPRSGLLPGAYTILLSTDRGIMTGRVVLLE